MTREFVRYLLVGMWNTLFGYAVFAGGLYLLTGRVPHDDMVAMVISQVLAITNAYVGYKLFVFRTAGNVLREYLRFYVVYGPFAVLNVLGLPLVAGLVRQAIGQSAWVLRAAPAATLTIPDPARYVAGALVMALTVCGSFLGHKHFSFRQD